MLSDKDFETKERVCNLEVCLAKPDELECNLVTLGHDLSLSKDDATEAAMGIVMKGLGPGYCWALKDMLERGREPQDFVCALVNVAALIIGFTIQGMFQKEGHKMIREDVAKMFLDSMEANMNHPRNNKRVGD